MKKNLPVQKVSGGIILFIFISLHVFSQPFFPVAINGFNNDVVAETGTSSLTTTTVSLDGFTVSNKVMYTNTFRTANGFGGGGIPDNGVITYANGAYQLADYASNNALVIQRNQNGDLNITTPAAYSRVRILCFSTEGASLVNINLFFTDGTSTTALTNYSLGDWFNNSTNVVLSGFGRCTRATPATGDDAYPDNPRLYYIDIPLSCTDMQKNLQKINFANVTTAGTNAPYPNAVFFAVSATSYSETIDEVNIANATCTNGGGVTLGVMGSGSPYNIAWNTTPPLNGVTILNLAPGIYTATITDVNGCVATHDVTIGLDDNLTMAVLDPVSICPGTSLNVNVTSNATGYAWTPTTGVSDPGIANPVLTPASTTTYTVTGTLGTCTISRGLSIFVDPQITLIIPGSSTICQGGSTTPAITSNATSFSWAPATGVSDPAIANPVLSPSATTNYSITATSGSCSVNATFNLIVAPPVSVNAGNNVTIVSGQTIQLQGSGDPGTYLWTPSTGLSATNILNPIASPAITTTYTLTTTSSLGCTGSDDVEIEVAPACAKPMNAITPNGDGINDKWLVTYGNCLSVASVKVFNRYGSPVFESNNYQNDWQGTYKGKPLPDATYYFVIEYKSSNGNIITLRGDLTILR